MAVRMYIHTDTYWWIISLLIFLTECSVHIVGYSECYNHAAKASIPAALMCYNNEVTGSRVIVDVFRAKESSSTDCECTVTSDTPTKFNFSTYNNHIPGTGCDSTLLFIVNGDNIAKSCYVDDFQLPTSNRSDTSVNIQTSGPQSVISTDYCVMIESDTVLTLHCNGDNNLPLTSQVPSSITTTTTTLTSTPTETTSATSPTTSKPSTTITSTTVPTSTSTTITVSTTAVSPKSVSSAYNPTSTIEFKSTVTFPTTIQSQSPAVSSSTWSFAIPTIGMGFILMVALVMAVCHNQRKKSKYMYQNTSDNINSPYSRDYTYENDEFIYSVIAI